MGLERAERLQREHGVEIELRAFLLRPDIQPGGLVRQSRPGEAEPGSLLTGHIGDMAKEVGRIMRRAPKTAYTIPALEATEFAKQVGKVEPFHIGVFKALWEDGEDIEDFAVLRKVAEQSGIDWSAMERALVERTYQEAVEQQMEAAVAMGINAIPAFVMGNRGFMGAQPYDIFERLLNIVLQEEGQSPR
ncbi:MAG: DsbA family protein [Chloroflexi bacterium]|nr:DsbA family protein [Chloroflexota bacterium]